MYIFGTTLLDRDYKSLETPLKKLVPISHYGFPEEFYGGRVKYIGELKDSPIKLLVDNTDGLQVIDIMVEKIEDIPFVGLKQFARDKKIEFEKTTTREELIQKITPLLLKLD